MTTKKVSFRMSYVDLQAIDDLVKNRVFQNRSAFFKLAVEKLLQHYATFEASLKEAAQ